MVAFTFVPVWSGWASLLHSLLWLLLMVGFHIGMYYAGFRSEALDAEVLLREVAMNTMQQTEHVGT